jgi:hypothetical protein
LAVWKLVAAWLLLTLLTTGRSTMVFARQEAETTPCPAATGVTSGIGDTCSSGGPTSELAPEIPPPDLPSTNEQGYAFELNATLATSLGTVPSQAPIYEMTRAAAARGEVEALAKRVGITGPVDNQGQDAFAASGNGELFVSPELIQYVAPVDPGPGSLPPDEQAEAAARDWLDRADLNPRDLGDGRVVSRPDSGDRVILLFSPTEPGNVLASIPSITVSVGVDNQVLEVSSRWATIRRTDLYELRDVEKAWSEVQSGEAYIETDLGKDGPPQGATVKGSVKYDTIQVAYTSAGPPGATQYLLPLFVFSGRLTLDGRDGSVPLKAYVVALANSGAPVGLTSDRRG